MFRHWLQTISTSCYRGPMFSCSPEFGCAQALHTSKRPIFHLSPTCRHVSLQCGATHPMCFAHFPFFGCSKTLSPAMCREMSRIGRARLLQILHLWPCDAEWHWHQHDRRHLWRSGLSKRHSLTSIPRFSQLHVPLQDLQKPTKLYCKYLSSLKLMLHRTSCVVGLIEPSTRKNCAVRVQAFHKTWKPLGLKTNRKNVSDPSKLIMLTKLLSLPLVEIIAAVYLGSLRSTQVLLEILQHSRMVVGLKLDKLDRDFEEHVFGNFVTLKF